jgi:hypothetical protein
MKMPPPVTGPLQKADLDKINQQLANLANLQKDIDMARTAGVPCDEHDALCQSLQRNLDAIRQTYFPSGKA